MFHRDTFFDYLKFLKFKIPKNLNNRFIIHILKTV